jgi:hypothetical protein
VRSPELVLLGLFVVPPFRNPEIRCGWRGEGSAEASRFAVAEVQQIGQGIVRADGVNEIALRALRDRDHGHRRGGEKEPPGRVSWPIAAIGRILSPRSVAEFDGE